MGRLSCIHTKQPLAGARWEAPMRSHPLPVPCPLSDLVPPVGVLADRPGGAVASPRWEVPRPGRAPWPPSLRCASQPWESSGLPVLRRLTRATRPFPLPPSGDTYVEVSSLSWGSAPCGCGPPASRFPPRAWGALFPGPSVPPGPRSAILLGSRPCLTLVGLFRARLGSLESGGALHGSRVVTRADRHLGLRWPPVSRLMRAYAHLVTCGLTTLCFRHGRIRQYLPPGYGAPRRVMS